MSNNGTKGAAKLASAIQGRMAEMIARNSSVSVEAGEILSDYKLKISSIPGQILDKDDYSVCSTIQRKIPCQKEFPIKPGDRVLVVWTYDGEVVVIDKLVSADSSEAKIDLNWEVHCSHCTSPTCPSYGNGESN